MHQKEVEVCKRHCFKTSNSSWFYIGCFTVAIQMRGKKELREANDNIVECHPNCVLNDLE